MSERNTIPTHNDTPLLLDMREAARLIGVSKRTLEHWTACGLVPSIKLGRRRLFDREELRRWIRSLPREGGRPGEHR